ncbi:MAG: SH3 domain-containing protein [Candidatus Omnitrophota bacterium]
MQYAKIILIASLYFLAISSYSLGQEGMTYPRTAFIKNDGSNARAGYNTNFQSIYRFEQSDPIKIIGEYFDWYKVMLPKKASVYIKKDYVNKLSRNIGLLNATKVNLRSGPDLKYAVLGQISEPEKVYITSEKDGWYEIQPPKDTAGWIHKSQIVFSLSEI